jgi:hypothetical protein
MHRNEIRFRVMEIRKVGFSTGLLWFRREFRRTGLGVDSKGPKTGERKKPEISDKCACRICHLFLRKFSLVKLRVNV